ncbi:hypothetical protein B0H14DRAFT_2616955 [Mycena olivaceomarginata]|nr:hypothetical protein B0H14DRAFT_2616955 [Mycena olivaceomarginata]
MDSPPTTPLECIQSKCHNLVPYSGPKTPKTCEDCREPSRKSQAAGRKRKRDAKEAQEAKKRARVSDASGIDATLSRDCAENPGMGSGPSDEEDFHGTCQIPEDPLITDKERVKITIYEIWKITGYRFSCLIHSF